MKTFVVLFIIVLICTSVVAAKKDHWLDTYYQYRIPVVVDVDQAGWNIIPIDQSTITDRINRNEELRFDPMFFAYNQVKVVEVDNDGKLTNPSLKAGFYIVPDSEELFTEKMSGKEQTVDIPTEKGAYYLVKYKSQGGGKSPVFHYEQVFPVGSSMRKHAYMSSYEAPLLEQKLKEYECLLISDGELVSIRVKDRWVTGVKAVSVKKVKIEFLANIPRPGSFHLDPRGLPNFSHSTWTRYWGQGRK